MNRNCNIWQVNTVFHGVFQSTQMIAFKRSKNLQKITAGYTVKQGKVLKKNLARLKGKCMPCSSTRPSLCSTKILHTQRFMSQQTKKTFHIFQLAKVDVIYLMEFILWKIQYVGKSTPFNLRLDNHRKDVITRKWFQLAIILKYMVITSWNMLIEQLSNVSKGTLRLKLKRIFGSSNSRHLLPRDLTKN